MGAWGTGLYSDDFALDVKSEFLGAINSGKPYREAFEELKKTYVDNAYNDDPDIPVFWFVCADILWKKGRLDEDIKQTTLAYIESNSDVERWNLESSALGKKRKTVLEKLKAKLLSPQPEAKPIRIKKFYECPWNIGDVFAYPLISNLAKENGLHGKFIIFQVAAKRKMKKNVDEYPVVRCWIAEELTFPPKTTCVKWSSIPRNDGNYNYGYFMIASSIRSVPKSIRFIGNFAEYIPVDDGGNIEEASDGVIWKCFEEKIVKDYLRDIE